MGFRSNNNNYTFLIKKQFKKCKSTEGNYHGMIFVVNKKLKKKKIRCIKTKLVTKKTKNILSYKAIVVVSAVKLDVS